MTDPTSPAANDGRAAGYGSSGSGSDAGEARRRPVDCPECGTRAAPGQSFCDSCGAVLGWNPGPGPAAAPTTNTDPERASEVTARQESDAQVTARPEEADTAAPGPSGTPSSPPGTTTSQDAATVPVERQQPDSAAADERARALLVPVADPEGRADAAPSVAPVLPGRPEAARPRAQAPVGAPDEDGGPPCQWCGTGNRPDRHFCRRCAMSLAARPDGPVRLPWWRRILDRNNRPAPWAGSRPRLRRDLGRILSWIAWALVIALVVTAAFNVGTAVDAVRDHFAKRAPVGPDTVAASRSYQHHGPEKVFDKYNNTWWGPGVTQAGEGEWIEARFQEPVRLLDLLITPGKSARPADLTKATLPHRVEALITTSKGHHLTRSFTLDQASGAQRVPFRVGEVSSVRFVVRSSYQPNADNQVSFAEIEFFGRSQASSS
ncbi:zinc ribbon domain-containing protein [Streptomyces sp. NPDC000151]|uniref:zinc ribbon domain-containing protein n=1 Tax=Streptomyces sp. NPDC000151 TaxID=3154244 RepID=UPI003319E748